MLKDWIRRLFAKFNLDGRDISVLVVSLLLASVIWLIHNLSLNYSDTMSVPVVAKCNLDGHANVSSNSSIVAARCRTTGYALLRNRFKSERRAIEINFDPSDMQHVEGEVFSVSAAQLSNYVNELFGDGISLESFLSDKVQFRFPYENNKKVPVLPAQVLSFRPQYMAVGPMTLLPDSVTIYGEPHRLESIERVNTRTIELTNLSANAHGSVKIEPISGIRMSATETNYSLEVSRFVELTSVVTISLRNVPSGKRLSVYPSTAKVTYRCLFPLMQDPTEEVRFYIDYKDFVNSIEGKCVPSSSSLPQGVIDYVIEPEVFECVEER